MQVTIPIPSSETIQAISIFIVVVWTAWQDLRHKIKFGDNVTFIKKKSIKKDAKERAS
jgi:hypothetical protein